MSDIFLANGAQLGGAFSAELAKLSFGGTVSNALVQNVNATYVQNVTRLYEVGNNATGKTNVYYVGGRTQGTLGIGRVLGPTTTIGAFYDKFGKVCNARTNNISLTFDPLSCDGGFGEYLMAGCCLTQVGVSVAAQDMIVNEQSQMIFASMEFNGDIGGGGDF